MAENNVVEGTTENDDIELRGFDFNFYNGDEKEVGREGSSKFPYLLNFN